MVFETNIKDITEKEENAYKDFIAQKNGGSLAGIQRITVTLRDDGMVDIDYDEDRPFERIRRITGRDARQVA